LEWEETNTRGRNIGSALKEKHTRAHIAPGKPKKKNERVRKQSPSKPDITGTK
jgi:hypothetical protein